MNGFWIVFAALAVVFAFLLRFLRALYEPGELRTEELGIVRTAQLLPVGILVLLLAAEVALVSQASALIPWMPYILGITVAIVAVWALERSRRTLLRHRHTGEEP